MGLDSTLAYFPSLKWLGIGSPDTRYFAYPLLEKVDVGLHIEIHDMYKHSLLVPSYDVIIDTEKKKGLLEKEKSGHNARSITNTSLRLSTGF